MVQEGNICRYPAPPPRESRLECRDLEGGGRSISLRPHYFRGYWRRRFPGSPSAQESATGADRPFPTPDLSGGSAPGSYPWGDFLPGRLVPRSCRAD
jgi:hypothetical protein